MKSRNQRCKVNLNKQNHSSNKILKLRSKINKTKISNNKFHMRMKKYKIYN